MDKQLSCLCWRFGALAGPRGMCLQDSCVQRIGPVCWNRELEAAGLHRASCVLTASILRKPFVYTAGNKTLRYRRLSIEPRVRPVIVG